MKTEILRDWGAVERLEGEWNQLLARSRSDTVFLREEWVGAWRAVQKDRPEPFVITARDADGRLVGIAPLYRTRYRFLKLVPLRVLRVLADYPTGAECLDWILDERWEAAAADAIAAALSSEKHSWDLLWMPYVPEWTGGRDRIRRSLLGSRLLYAERPVGFGYLELPESMDAFLARLNPRDRTSYRRDNRIVFGELQARFVHCERPEEIGRYLEALFRLHAKRWGREGELGSFRKKPRESSFYQAFAPVAFERGWLRIYGIELAGEFQAVQIGYLFRNSFLSVQEGYDPEGCKGVGKTLRFKVLEALIREGVEVYDFLGELSEHKRRWRAVERSGWNILAGPPKATNRALFAAGVWPTGRYLRHADAAWLRGGAGA
jgi:CelD/BcsL family acetyltransferase involved in cellulose biosynthesis